MRQSFLRPPRPSLQTPSQLSLDAIERGNTLPPPKWTIMNFRDTQLEACFELNLAKASGVSDELRQVSALIATHDWFWMIEGRHSSRVHETIDHLLSPGLRAGLRDWYRRSGAEMNSTAIEFRDHLSQLAGERLENTR